MNKTLHYCWFGHNELPAKTLHCIESWRRYFPDFDIKRWDEGDFDVHQCQYVHEAYESKKWAFVSDYARFKILEQYGGMYFDTDVEVIRSMSDLCELEAFAGFEGTRHINPGLVLWSKGPHQQVISAMRKKYESIPFLDEQGNRIRINVCGLFTDLLDDYGLVRNGAMQTCGGMTLFPNEYFNPFDDATGVLNATENTYAIHWYDKSWMPKRRVFRNRCTRILHRILGTDIRKKVYKLVGKDA